MGAVSAVALHLAILHVVLGVVHAAQPSACLQALAPTLDAMQGKNGTIGSNDAMVAIGMDVAREIHNKNNPLYNLVVEQTSSTSGGKEETNEEARARFQKQAKDDLGATYADLIINNNNTKARPFGVVATDNYTMIAFRGTENVNDVLTDINALKTDVTFGKDTVKVHRGFWNAWQAVKPDVMKQIKEHPSDRIYIVGPSLGGAVAQLAAADLSLNEGVPVTAVYSYAAPRVGTPDWVTMLEKNGLNDKILQFVDPRDVVPFLPTKKMGFERAGRPVMISPSSCQDMSVGGLDALPSAGRNIKYHNMVQYSTYIDTECLTSAAREVYDYCH